MGQTTKQYSGCLTTHAITEWVLGETMGITYNF